jgi:Zn-dependent protease with chaperone function
MSRRDILLTLAITFTGVWLFGAWADWNIAWPLEIPTWEGGSRVLLLLGIIMAGIVATTAIMLAKLK